MSAPNLIQELSNSWGWVGLEPAEVIGENDFGNLMIKDTSGKYWRLCPEECSCRIVAEARDELDALAQEQEFLEDWLMLSLVEVAKAMLGPLRPGYKYAFVIAPVLGGKYESANMQIAPLYEVVRLSGEIGKQIQDLPDESQVCLKVVD